MLEMSTILVQPQSSPWQSCINHPLTLFPILIQCVELFPHGDFKLFQSIRAFSENVVLHHPEDERVKISTCSGKVAKFWHQKQATRSGLVSKEF